MLWTWHWTEVVQPSPQAKWTQTNGRNSLPRHWEGTEPKSKTYYTHTTMLCIVRPHTPVNTVYSLQKATTTQMKGSMHTILDNLSDHWGHAKWQKGHPPPPKFLLHEKTSFIWLTLRWIICIFKTESKSIANFPWRNTAMKLYKVTYTDCMCVWNILYMNYITAFFCCFFFVHKCSTALWVKLGMKWTVEHKGEEVPWVNLHITPPQKNPKHLQKAAVPRKQSNLTRDEANTVPKIQ